MPSNPDEEPGQDVPAEVFGGVIEVQVTSEDAEALEAVSALFDRVGWGGAVLEQDAEGTPPVIKTYLAEGRAAARTNLEIGLALLQKAYPSLGAPVFCRLGPEDWSQAWKRGYRTQHIGKALVVVPSWETYTPQPGQQVIHLEPGLAFGSGLHATTRLCLELLEAHLTPGSRVLDVGTGSGILAIAAARLGAGAVVALEADPGAVAVARENVRRNRVTDQVQVRWATLPGGQPNEWDAPVLTLPEIGTPFLLAVVNILIPTLTDIIRAGLPRALTSGGLLIATGMILEQEREVAKAMQEAGLSLAERRLADEWVALVGRRGGD